jgi:hypothetical protein
MRKKVRHALRERVLAAVGVLILAGVANAAPKKALINGDTVVGSPSQEEAIATAAGFTVTVVSDAIWAAMTAPDFAQYDLLIAGDPFCGTLPPGLVSSAPVYGSVVLGTAGGRTAPGNRIVVGTDPVLHDGGVYTGPDARGTVIREGIAYAGNLPGTTGMYFDSTCAANYFGQSAETLAILNALSAGGGAWTIDAVPPCGGSVSLIASDPAFTDLTTASLQGWSCSVHESFPTFRDDWNALAVATDTISQPTCGIDPHTGLNACGEAYILITSGSIIAQGISVSPLDATNPVGTSHTVTANVHAAGGAPPVVGALVTFTVTGVNAGAVGTCVPADCKSDSNGDVSFTYLDTNGAGDDTIKASFTDAAGSLQSATATKHWVGGGCGPNGTACEDGNACTTGDTCVDGTCQGGPRLVCDDHNVCTDDTCNPASGCVFTDNTAPCEDGNPCTTGDICADGVCKHGGPTNCDDGNCCTIDGCDLAPAARLRRLHVGRHRRRGSERVRHRVGRVREL